MFRRAAIVLVSLAVLASAAGASSLFTLGPAEPDGLTDVYPAVVDRALLTSNPDTLDLDLPGLPQMTAVRDVFEPREGFDAGGVLLPGVLPEETRFLWSGSTVEGFTVVLTGYYEVTAGSFNGPLGTYSLMRGTIDSTMTHDHLLRDATAETWDLSDPDAFWAEPNASLEEAAMLPTASGFGRMSSERFLRKVAFPGEDLVWIDVAAVYSAGALAQVDGDVRNMKALIYNSFDTANIGFGNSRTRVRLNPVRVMPTTFEASGDGGTADRTNLRLNPDVLAIRFPDPEDETVENPTVEADIVTAFVGDHDTVNYRGYAFVQRHGCGDFQDIPGCDVGESFKGHAFNLVATSWALLHRYVLLHEVAHNLGAEHDFSGVIPRDRASFPWSYALLTFDFKTVMSTGSDMIPRLLLLTHPDILFDDGGAGIPVGVHGEAYNALTIDSLAVVVADFGNPPSPVLFFDGFESGDLILWSLVTP